MQDVGGAVRPVVHVQDVSRAFAAILQAPIDVIHNEAFNLGANHLNQQIIDVIQQHHGDDQHREADRGGERLRQEHGRDLLRHAEGAVDCILRGEGEASVVALLDAAARGSDLLQVPGAVTVAGEGPSPRF